MVTVASEFLYFSTLARGLQLTTEMVMGQLSLPFYWPIMSGVELSLEKFGLGGGSEMWNSWLFLPGTEILKFKARWR